MSNDDDKTAEYFGVLPPKLVRGTCYRLLVPLTAYLGGHAGLCLGETDSGAYACKPAAAHLLHIDENTANGSSLSSSYAFQITLVTPSSGFIR